MAIVWLTVYEENEFPGFGKPYQLWWREVAVEGQPRPCDQMMLLVSDEEPYGSVQIDVRDVYWDIDGVMNIQLRHIVHLPDEHYEAHLSRFHQGDHEHYIRTTAMPWRDEDDSYGKLDDRLVQSGWQRYTSDNKPTRSRP